jgi:sugar/nucleoside kinase (ribokinase family)
VSKPVLAIGEILIDLIVSDDAPSLEQAGAFFSRAGGAPANAAVAIARLGLPAAFCGVCGDDPFGSRLRNVLRGNDVDDAALRSTAESDTTLAFAWKDAGGDGHFRLLRMADRLLNAADVRAANVQNAAALIAGSVSLSAEPSRAAVELAIELASQAGVPICLDLNIRPTLWPRPEELQAALNPLILRATLLKLSVDDATLLYGASETAESVFHRAREMGIPFVVLTDGARGCWYSDANGEPVYLPAFKIEAVEPTGAGDAFTAAIISRLLANAWSGISQSDAEYASASGALTAMRPGAMESLPTSDEIEKFLASYPNR